MKKGIFSILFLFLLSGCSAEYNLTITEDNFEEITTLATDTSLEPLEQYEDADLKDTFDKLLNEYYAPVYFNDEKYDYYEGGYQNNVTFYNLNKYVKGTKEGLTASHSFNYLDFYRSSIVKQCFKELSTQNTSEYILLRTNNKCDAFNEYPLLDDITINITTDLEVIVTNADKEVGNTYTWNINRDNYTNKSVQITYVAQAEEENDVVTPTPVEPEPIPTEEQNRLDNKYYGLIIIVSFIALAMVIFSVVKYKKSHY